MCAKSVFLEGSAHIPMLVRPPQPAHPLRGARCGALVTLADLAPTIMAAAGIECPAETDGLDMMALAADADAGGADADAGGVQAGRKDRTFFGNCGNTYFAVMEDGYKYLWTAYGGDELLFYLPDDPMERKDLAKVKPEITQRMKSKLIEQVSGYNASLVRNGELVTHAAIKGPGDVNKWPGFHSTVVLSDVLH